MGVNQSFIESVELSNGTEVTAQVSGSGSRVYLSIDGNPISLQMHLEPNDLAKLIPVLELAQAYIKSSR